MAKKIIGIILFLVIFGSFIPTNISFTSVPKAAGFGLNTIIIDGVVGTDWTDGAYSVTVDGDVGELDRLYLAVNETGLNIALTAMLLSDEKGYLVYFDIDGDVGGINSPSESLMWTKRPFNFVGIKPDFFIGSWGLFSLSLYNATVFFGQCGIIKNETILPSMTTFEGFVPWSIFYPSGTTTYPVVMGAQIKILAIRVGGDDDATIYDTIPSNKNPIVVDNWVILPVDSDGDMIPDLNQPAIGWAGNEYDSSLAGVGVAGIPLEISISVWYNSLHEFPNSSLWPIICYRVYNVSESLTPNEWKINSMFHFAEDYQGSNDWYRYYISTEKYIIGDIIEWFITSTYTTTTPRNVTLGPMLPIDIGWVGSPNPSGGTIAPNTQFDITIEVEQLWNGIEIVQGNFGTNVTLFYTLNETAIWYQQAFDYVGPTGTLNTLFKAHILGYPDGTNLTFYITVETNNDSYITPNSITLYILIPPPEELIFHMTDPEGDEYGDYPFSTYFGDGDGLFDLLEFNVTANNFGTTFHFRLADVYDPGWGKGYWSHPIFGVMVDIVDGGNTTGIANSIILTETGWEHGFLVEGWQQKYYTPTSLSNPQTTNTGITLGNSWDLENKTYWFSFHVPKTLIGSVAEENWRYFILVGSDDTNRFRNHKAVAEEWVFGGGDDGGYDPNYVDILVPQCSDPIAVQELITESYDVALAKKVTVLAVGNGVIFEDDVSDPLISITSPANGTIYTLSTTTISVTTTWVASDPVQGSIPGLDYMEMSLNGVIIPGIVLEAGIFDLELGVGTHIIVVTVYDLTGNYGSDSITIIVQPPPFEEDMTDPIITITSPANGTIYTLTTTSIFVTVTWTASDAIQGTNAGLDYMQMSLDGINVSGAVLETGTFDLELGVGIGIGTHDIAITVYDLTGNYGSDSISIVVEPPPFEEDITDPIIIITSPANGTKYTINTTSILVTISWVASDAIQGTNAGLNYMQMTLDSINVSGVVLETGTFDLVAGVGSHVIVVTVYDLTGNYGNASITIIVEATTTTTTTTSSNSETTPTNPFKIDGYSHYIILAMMCSAIILSFIIKKKSQLHH